MKRIPRPRVFDPFRWPLGASNSRYQIRLSSSASSSTTPPKRPTTAPKPTPPLRHIRENPDLYSHNCLRRNYPAHAPHPARIAVLFSEWKDLDLATRELRHKLNTITKQIATAPSPSSREALLTEARAIKAQLQNMGDAEPRLKREMEDLALTLPNLTSESTPEGNELKVLSYINDPPVSSSAQERPSHVEIGQRLGILDFGAAAATSGHGWYFLVGDGAALEQALVQFALRTAARAGWTQVAPPSVVYAHVAAACGFQPRDEAGESQIYSLTNSNLHHPHHQQQHQQQQQQQQTTSTASPELCLAGTAEIPLAGMLANTTLQPSSLPLRRVAASRCYRAEAGSYGAAARGLYRVHEFTKVELFAWTAPDDDAASELFDEMLDLQTEILGSLGLHCRVLEMPAHDLGAAAARKCDIEAYFPSRARTNEHGVEIKPDAAGWGEVTSTSICTDYQTRRLGTRVPVGDKTGFPYTVNGTALAVPRVIAAVLENGWDVETGTVEIPEVLRPWMDGKERIGPVEAS